MKFFSYESKFSQLVLMLCQSCLLNVLWFICSIPIVTIGASTTALYYVCLKIVRGEEQYVIPMFFRSFKENFRQATQLWLIMLGAGFLLGTDGYILSHLRTHSTGPAAVLWTLLFALLIAASIVYVIVLLYVFPLTASVVNTNKAMLKNSFLIGTHYLFATILAFAVHFAMFFAVVRIFTPLAIFGEGLCAMMTSALLNRVLAACSYDPEKAETVDGETETGETEKTDVPDAEEEG